MTNAKETQSKRTIAVGDEYRLAFDENNVMIERLITVDPTKAPRFDPAKHDPTPRQVWRNIDSYHSTVPRALTAVLEYKMRNGEAATLRELLAEVRGFKAFIERELGAEV